MKIGVECPCCNKNTEYNLKVRIRSRMIIVEKAVGEKDFAKMLDSKLIGAELKPMPGA